MGGSAVWVSFTGGLEGPLLDEEYGETADELRRRGVDETQHDATHAYLLLLVSPCPASHRSWANEPLGRVCGRVNGAQILSLCCNTQPADPSQRNDRWTVEWQACAWHDRVRFDSGQFQRAPSESEADVCRWEAFLFSKHPQQNRLRQYRGCDDSRRVAPPPGKPTEPPKWLRLLLEP